MFSWFWLRASVRHSALWLIYSRKASKLDTMFPFDGPKASSSSLCSWYPFMVGVQLRNWGTADPIATRRKYNRDYRRRGNHARGRWWSGGSDTDTGSSSGYASPKGHLQRSPTALQARAPSFQPRECPTYGLVRASLATLPFGLRCRPINAILLHCCLS